MGAWTRALKTLHFGFWLFTIEILSNLIANTMKLDQFTTMRGYQLAATRTNGKIIDAMLNGEQGEEIREGLKLKRIQFDTSPKLWERLESICSMLDCSKREFLEMVISEAIDRAEENFQQAFQDASGMDIADAFPAAE